jgi:NTP pyrophosphatase (non-canonical NTP hydrolase)
MASFVQTKGWYRTDSARPQTPRNLVMSMAIEVAELLECFQWSETAASERVEDELADVVLYAVQLANVAGVDLEAAVTAKLERNYGRTWDAVSQR